MHMRRLRSFLPAAMILIAAFSVPAQKARRDFNRPQTFDAQHYTLRVSFDRPAKKLIGDTTVSLKPLKTDFRVVELDAVDLAFDSVSLDPVGTPLRFKTAAGKVSIDLDKAYGPDDLVTLRLKYTALPKKGVYFIDAQLGPDLVNHSPQIWTQGEPDEARHWFPSFDFPSDKATFEEILTVPQGETVIGNGELVSRRPNADGTETWHYKMAVPHSTYLVSFVIGNYLKVEQAHKNVPLAFYVYPGQTEIASKAFGATANMMAAYEELTGVAFPFSKYDQTIVSGFPLGGMENITATTMSDSFIFLSSVVPDEVRDLVSHELAHSWFGNLVTCRNWAELWLNEGFATFMEAAYVERAAGRAKYIQKIRSDAAEFLIDDTINKKRHALYNQRAANVAGLFDNAATTYHKGGAVIHTLREQVGNEAFWRAINIYLTRHRTANVESTDLLHAMEEASGQDLDWFFDQWVYSTGAPHMRVSQAYNPRSKTLFITVAQTQAPGGITPAAFRLPLELAIKTSHGETKHDIEVTRRQQTFSIKTNGRPTAVRVDPDERIPLKEVRMRPIGTR